MNFVRYLQASLFIVNPQNVLDREWMIITFVTNKYKHSVFLLEASKYSHLPNFAYTNIKQILRRQNIFTRKCENFLRDFQNVYTFFFFWFQLPINIMTIFKPVFEWAQNVNIYVSYFCRFIQLSFRIWWSPSILLISKTC